VTSSHGELETPLLGRQQHHLGVDLDVIGFRLLASGDDARALSKQAA
jgi:hypothetical protein